MQYGGVIIEESLKDKTILGSLKVKDIKVESITPEHKTPWFKQWTLHTVFIPEEMGDHIAEKISKSFDYSHGSAWYADFKNDKTHYIIFEGKVFKIDRSKKKEYQKATEYGISLGIPEYQVDFAPNVSIWER